MTSAPIAPVEAEDTIPAIPAVKHLQSLDGLLQRSGIMAAQKELTRLLGIPGMSEALVRAMHNGYGFSEDDIKLGMSVTKTGSTILNLLQDGLPAPTHQREDGDEDEDEDESEETPKKK